MDKVLMTYTNSDGEECVVISDGDDSLYVFNKYKMTVFNYHPMGSLIDILKDIDFEQGYVYMAEEDAEGLKSWLKEYADDIDSGLMFNVLTAIQTW